MKKASRSLLIITAIMVVVIAIIIVLVGCARIGTLSQPASTIPNVTAQGTDVSTTSEPEATTTPPPTRLPSPTPLRSTSTPSSSTVITPDATVGITFEEDQTIGPFPPQALRLSRLPNGAINLEWFDADPLIKYFNVYRRENANAWINIGRVTADPKKESFSFVDQSARKDTPYVYAVTAVDVYDNESEYSDSATITVSGN